jgi:monoamine oxidase
VTVNVKQLEIVNSTISSPAQSTHVTASIFPDDNDDDTTIIASNCSTHHSATNINSNISPQSTSKHQQYAHMLIEMTHAIADMGATSIFVMEGTPMENIRPTLDPITINLPDGKKVMSTHTCNIMIPGLPTVLMGHIVPGIKWRLYSV